MLFLTKDAPAPFWLKMKAVHWGQAERDARSTLRGFREMLGKMTLEDARKVLALDAQLCARN
jgi:hypothetical protein